MAGLNCGTPSPLAWPSVSRGIDLFLAIDDEWARWGMHALAESDLVAVRQVQPVLAAWHALLRDPKAEAHRQSLGIGASTRVLVVCTEGRRIPRRMGGSLAARA